MVHAVSADAEASWEDLPTPSQLVTQLNGGFFAALEAGIAAYRRAFGDEGSKRLLEVLKAVSPQAMVMLQAHRFHASLL